MFYQLNMQVESHPQEQQFSCYTYYSPEDESHGFQAHCHAYTEIAYAVDKVCHMSINGQTVTLEKGQLLFIPPLSIHETFDEWNDGTSMILQFSNRFLSGLENGLEGTSLLMPTDGSPGVLDTTKDDQTAFLMKKIVDICRGFPDPTLPPEQNDRIYGLCDEQQFLDAAHTTAYWKLKGVVFQLLSAFLEIGFLSVRSSGELSKEELFLMQPLMVEMIQSPQQNLTLEEAAQKLNMSYSHFSRTFKKMMGVNYVDYKNHLRIRYAEQLLLKTDKSVTEIAQIANYGNLTYFNKIFKRTNGVSPTKYRMNSKKR